MAGHARLLVLLRLGHEGEQTRLVLALHLELLSQTAQLGVLLLERLGFLLARLLRLLSLRLEHLLLELLLLLREALRLLLQLLLQLSELSVLPNMASRLVFERLGRSQRLSEHRLGLRALRLLLV